MKDAAVPACRNPVLLQLLSTTDPAAARKFLAAKCCSKGRRKELAKLAGLEVAWVNCDQAVPGNVADLADSIVSELHEPFWFFRRCLSGMQPAHSQPAALFDEGKATSELEHHKGWWTAKNGLVPCAWQLPARGETFDAVCHVVQAASGTAVHVGGGSILTCAHVIDQRDDADLEEVGELPARRGRQKLVMFASGRTFLAECVAVDESTNGTHDVSVLVLRSELDVSSLPHAPPAPPPPGGGGGGAEVRGTVTTAALPPAARVAAKPVEAGDRLFCIGNPSSIDLESLRGDATIEFSPPAWHASVGQCQGYQSSAVHAAREAQSARGRAPTRGERKLVDETLPVGADQGGTCTHR